MKIRSYVLKVQTKEGQQHGKSGLNFGFLTQDTLDLTTGGPKFSLEEILMLRRLTDKAAT